MPDYQYEVQEEEVIHRNNNNNNVRKIWLQNRGQNNNGFGPVSTMDTLHENRTDLQVSPSGRCRTALSLSQNVDGGAPGTLGRQNTDDNDCRMQMSPLPVQNGCPASNLNLTHVSSFPYPFAPSDLGAEAPSVVSGYQHCAAEALRYLVEEENLSPDDPLVAGLRQHLSVRERQMDPEIVLMEYLMMAGRPYDDEDGHPPDDEEFSEDDDDDSVSDAMLQSLAHVTSAYLSGTCLGRRPDELSPTEPEVRWYGGHPLRVPDSQRPLCRGAAEDVSGAPSPTPSL